MHSPSSERATTVTKVGVTIAVMALLVVALRPTRSTEARRSDWEQAVRVSDEAYWAAYNRADPAAMNAMLADDAEFYHDRGGALIGKAALSKANEVMKTNTDRLRREPVAGSVRFSPLRRDEQVYGAVVSGEHQFFVTAQGKAEVEAGRARFTQLMLLKGTQWKVSRILSYDHSDAR